MKNSYTESYLKKHSIKIKHIRNSNNVPIATIATKRGTTEEDNIFYGLSLCSVKDSPNKKKGRIIAVGRLLSENDNVILGGKRGKAFEKELGYLLYGFGLISKTMLWKTINGIKQL